MEWEVEPCAPPHWSSLEMLPVALCYVQGSGQRMVASVLFKPLLVPVSTVVEMEKGHRSAECV